MITFELIEEDLLLFVRLVFVTADNKKVIEIPNATIELLIR